MSLRRRGGQPVSAGPLMGCHHGRMEATAPTQIDRQRIKELTEREEKAPRRAHGLGRDVPPRQQDARRRRGVVLPGARPVADLPRVAARARRSGTSTATRCGTSTTASARWCRATRTPRSAGRSPSATRRARTSPRRPRTRVVVGEELAERFRLPKWRYTNSGSESTMDAIRIARAFTKRDTVMKIFGSYHGHHDTVMVSIGVPYDKIGDPDNLASLPYGAGIPDAVVQHDRAGAVQRRRRDGAPDRAADRRGPQARLRDHGGGDDEPRGDPPRGRLPRGRARRSRTSTGSS